jgi:replicative superfamily II helicase
MKEYENFDVAIMTNERYDSFLRDPKKRNYLKGISLVIFDEIHMLGDESRGYRLESAIIKTKVLFPKVMILGTSATIDNSDDFAHNLEFDLHRVDKRKRPVKLITKLLTHRKQWNAKQKVFMKAGIIQRIKDKHKGKRILVFVTSRARTRQIPLTLAGLDLDNKIKLKDLVNTHRLAYHNAGLSKGDKHYVEKNFLNGHIDVLVSTPTLAYGVNLPADVVIVADMFQFNYLTGEEIIKKDRLEQTIGRAGRPQFSDVGYAYFLCNNESEYEVIKLLEEPFDITSKMYMHLKEVILEWIVSGIINAVGDAFKMLPHFFDKNISETDLIEALTYLERYGFITTLKGGNIRATFRGRMTAYHFIKPESVVFWDETLHKYGNNDMSLEFLFSLVSSVPEYRNIVTVYDYDSKILMYASKYFDSEEYKKLKELNGMFHDNVLKIFGYTFKDEIIHRFYDEIEMKYGKGSTRYFIKMSKSDSFIIRTSAERFISACNIILKLYPEMFNKLIVACQKGILDEEKLELINIKGIGIKKLEKLLKNGINSKEKFMKTENSVLSKMISMNEQRIKALKFEIITS